MSTNNQYNYSPLSGPRSTRLIMLYPSKDLDVPLSCKLVEIDVDNPIPYQALSYTWADEIPIEPMTVTADSDASHHPQTLLLTPNCAAALRLLRKRIKPKQNIANIGLWVDAICINQSSNDEKSLQVAMMASIYREAKDVVVWLGDEWTPRTWRDLLPTQIIGPFVKTNFIDVWGPFSKLLRPYISRRLDYSIYTRLGFYYLAIARAITKILLKVSPQDVLYHILTAPYWSRTWTLQEFAHPSATLLCLDASLCQFRRLKALSKTSAWADLHPQTSMYFHAVCVQFLGSTGELSLLDFWEGILGKVATDPRDKVFAVRELFPHLLGEITVDYTRPVEEIFANATRILIEKTRNLITIFYSIGSDGADKLPSWAVDWAPNRERSELYHWSESRIDSNACRLAASSISFSSCGYTLYLLGKKIGQIGNCVGEKIGSPNLALGTNYSRHPPTAPVSFFEALTYFLSTAEEPCGAVSPGSRLRNAWDLLLWILACYPWTNSLSNSLGISGGTTDVDSLIQVLRSNDIVCSMLLKDMENGRFFFTADGRAGVGLHTLRPGDSICIFAGVDAPFIVRPKGSSWVLVGPTIVDGAMNGEMWTDDEDELSTWEII